MLNMLVGFCINYIESFMDKYFSGCCCRCFDFGDDYGNVYTFIECVERWCMRVYWNIYSLQRECKWHAEEDDGATPCTDGLQVIPQVLFNMMICWFLGSNWMGFHMVSVTILILKIHIVRGVFFFLLFRGKDKVNGGQWSWRILKRMRKFYNKLEWYAKRSRNTWRLTLIRLSKNRFLFSFIMFLLRQYI